MNNQSQLALACINYDGAKQNLPPMRGKIGEKATTSENTTTTQVNVVSWIGFLLPYMELNQLYQNLSNVTITDSAANQYDTQLIRIKSLLCPSADPPEITNPATHYVCNGGYQNGIGTDWAATATTTTIATGHRLEPSKRKDAVFLDLWAYTPKDEFTDTNSVKNTLKVTLDYISSHSGTSNVILLSENERSITGGNASGGKGARWGYWANSAPVLVGADDEERIAFCYPYNKGVTDTIMKDSLSLAEYDAANEGEWSYKGYDNITTLPDSSSNADVPAFINKGRGREYEDVWTKPYRRARPSSNHPGIVLAAFADRSVRPLNENMEKRTFVWICQPDSGQVVSSDAF
jgi:hypothetical protein